MLGQILLRTIRSEQALNYTLLQSLANGLIDELKTAQNAPSTQDELENLRQVFNSIGVGIEVFGELPEDNAKAKLFVDIAREAVSNAVKHGFATEVHISFDVSEGVSRMRITNNGHPPPDSIKEGGGLSGMRKRVEPYEGEVKVDVRPSFVLTVSI